MSSIYISNVTFIHIFLTDCPSRTLRKRLFYRISSLTGWPLHPSVTWGWTHQWGASQWVPLLPPILFLHNTFGPALTECVAHLYICLDVRRGGHSCLSERTVDVSSVLYTIWAMMLTNCCVLFTGYAWSHVMCSAGAISALLFPLVCALCLHLECHFFLCSYVETACTVFALFFFFRFFVGFLCFIAIKIHTHTNTHTH